MVFIRLHGWYNLGNEAVSDRTPEAEEVDSEEIRAFQEIIDRSRRIVFFGGAGVSTASGIPDFRSADGDLQPSSLSYGAGIGLGRPHRFAQGDRRLA